MRLTATGIAPDLHRTSLLILITKNQKPIAGANMEVFNSVEK